MIGLSRPLCVRISPSLREGFRMDFEHIIFKCISVTQLYQVAGIDCILFIIISEGKKWFVEIIRGWEVYAITRIRIRLVSYQTASTYFYFMM